MQAYVAHAVVVLVPFLFGSRVVCTHPTISVAQERPSPAILLSGATLSTDGESIIAVDCVTNTVGIWSVLTGRPSQLLTCRPELGNIRDPRQISGAVVSLLVTDGKGIGTLLLDPATGVDLAYYPGISWTAGVPNDIVVGSSDGLLGASDPFLTFWRARPRQQFQISVGGEGDVVGRGCSLSQNVVILTVRPVSDIGHPERESTLVEVNLVSGKWKVLAPSRLTRCEIVTDHNRTRALLSAEGIAELIDLSTYEVIKRFQTKPSAERFWVASVSHKGEYVAVGQCGLSVWDVKGNCVLFNARTMDELVNWPVNIADPGYDNDDRNRGEYMLSLQNALVCLQFNAQDTQLVGVTHDGHVYVWEVPSGRLHRRFILGQQGVKLGEESSSVESDIACRLEWLRKGSRRQRREAIVWFIRHRVHGEVVLAHVMAALRDEDWYLRCASVQYMTGLCGPSEMTVKAIGNALRDDDYRVRECAAYGIARLSLGDKLSTEELVDAMHDDSLFVQVAIADAISGTKPISHDVTRALAEMIRARPFPELPDHQRARRAAAAALSRMGPDVRLATAALVDALADDLSEVREHASKALGNSGVASKNVVERLRELCNDKDSEVRAAAKDAVEKLVR